MDGVDLAVPVVKAHAQECEVQERLRVRASATQRNITAQ